MLSEGRAVAAIPPLFPFSADYSQHPFWEVVFLGGHSSVSRVVTYLLNMKGRDMIRYWHITSS